MLFFVFSAFSTSLWRDSWSSGPFSSFPVVLHLTSLKIRRKRITSSCTSGGSSSWTTVKNLSPSTWVSAAHVTDSSHDNTIPFRRTEKKTLFQTSSVGLWIRKICLWTSLEKCCSRARSWKSFAKTLSRSVWSSLVSCVRTRRTTRSSMRLSPRTSR